MVEGLGEGEHMKLRMKTLIIVGVMIVSMVAALYGVSQIILLNSFEELEEQYASENVERALAALSDELSVLDDTTYDWAAWDDTYNFIEDVNEYYIESNLVDETFTLLRLNIMLYVNSSDQIVFRKAFDLQKDEEIPVPESLLEHIQPGSLLLEHPDLESSVTGIVPLPEGPMLIASRPILTSEDEGPIRGTLIMGRYLDSEEVSRLAEVTHLSLTLWGLDGPGLPGDIESAKLSLSEDKPIHVQPIGRETVAGYALLEDVYGEPVLILKADMPRDIYRQGQASVSYFVMSLLAAGLLFGGMTVLLLERQVLSRLINLSRRVKDIGRQGTPSMRVSAAGKDEVSDLAESINEMLTGLEQSREMLEESESRYRTLVESSPNLIAIYQDGYLKYVNRAMCDVLGWTFEEMTSPSFNPIENMLPERFQALARENLARRLKGEQIPPFELVMRGRDGSEFTVICNAQNILYRGKPALEYIFVDITERKRVENALRDSEEKLRRVIESSPDAIAVTNLNGNLVECNQAALDMHGFSTKEEVIGKNAFEFVALKDRQMVEMNLEKTLRRGYVKNLEVTLITKDGREFPAELSVSVIPDAAGKPAGFILTARDITERKKIEEQLKFSSLILENISDSVIVTNLEGQVTYWNEGAARIFGFTAEEMLGESIVKLCKPKDREQIAQAQLEQLRNGIPFSGEWEGVRKSGEPVWLMLTTVPLKNSRGETVGLVGVGKDITEQKKVQDALRDSEARYRMQFEEALDAIFIADPETGILVDCNRAATELVGRDKSELIGKHQKILHPPEEVEGEFTRAFRQHAKEKIKEVLETQVITKSGEIKQVAIKANLFEFRGRRLIQGIFRDVTELKRAEEQIRESENKFRLLFNRAFDVNLMIDGEGKIVDVNEAACRLLGYTREELLKLTVEDIHPKDEMGKIRSAIRRVLRNGIDYLGETAFVTKEGKIIEVEAGGASFKVKGREYIIGSFRDITERKRAEAEKRTVAGQVARSIAHDIRNPLTAIRNAAYILKGDISVEERMKMLDLIDRDVVYADRILQNLIDFSSAIPPRLSMADVNRLLQETLAQNIIPENVKLKTVYGEIPRTMLDRDQMIRAFTNLILNAVQAIPKGGELTIATEKVGEHIEVRIKDTGVGIPKEKLQKIFDPFFTMKAKGTGLGLPNAKMLIEAHGGTINLESEKGKGTTVTVKLPIKPSQTKKINRL